jgi:hypothetical protein
MRQLLCRTLWRVRILRATRGQDLIEYALMAGFVAVAAGALMPMWLRASALCYRRSSSLLAAAAAETEMAAKPIRAPRISGISKRLGAKKRTNLTHSPTTASWPFDLSCQKHLIS